MNEETPARKPIPLRHVTAVVAGNALEFYDFLCYALFAVYIGKTFFPAKADGISLLLSLGTFGLGFVTRPIGALVIGGMGDRIGRKPAMLISFALMGAGMLGVAITPGFAQIGVAAPVLIVLFRLVQGFALGGQVGPATAYLIEAAPAESRGLYGSMQATSSDFGVLVASLVGVALTRVLSPAAFADWGWRIAFLIGLSIVPFGIIVRASLPETLPGPRESEHSPGAGDIRRYLKPIVLCLLILIAGTVGNYTLDYMTTYSLDTLHLPASIAFGVTVATSLCAVGIEPISGFLSDRFGRRPVMIVPAIIGLPMIIPAFWLVAHFPSRLTLYATMGALSIASNLSQTPIIIALTEILPPRIRAGAVSTVYAVAISIFGGSTQFMETWILKATGDPMTPAYYWTVAAVVSLCAMLLMPESAPRIASRKARVLADDHSLA